MASLRMTALALAALLSSGMAVGSASAMPANGLESAANEAASAIQDVRWVCGPYRCWWAPGPYWGYARGPYYWGPGPYWRWHRWHRW